MSIKAKRVYPKVGTEVRFRIDKNPDPSNPINPPKYGIGKIISIDGAYHYVQLLTNKKSIWELYENEFEIVNKAKK